MKKSPSKTPYFNTLWMNILLSSHCVTVLLQTAATQHGKGKRCKSIDANVDASLDCNIIEESRHRILDSNFICLHIYICIISFMTQSSYWLHNNTLSSMASVIPTRRSVPFAAPRICFPLLLICIPEIKSQTLLSSCRIFVEMRASVCETHKLYGPLWCLDLYKAQNCQPGAVCPRFNLALGLWKPGQAPPKTLTFKSLGRPGSAVLVRVKFQGQFAVGFLQLLLAGVPLHPQDLIVVPAPLYSAKQPTQGYLHRPPQQTHRPPRLSPTRGPLRRSPPPASPDPPHRPHRLTPSSCSAV